MRLQNLRHEKNGLTKRLERIFWMSGSVERQTDQVVEFGRSRLQLEAFLKSIERAVILLTITEPIPEFGISVRVRMGLKFGFEFFRASTGMNGRASGQDGPEY